VHFSIQVEFIIVLDDLHLSDTVVVTTIGIARVIERITKARGH
jgi:hypothetical protein